MKGYLYVASISEIEAPLRSTTYDKVNFQLDTTNRTFEGLGWIPLTAAIKRGNDLVVAAERHGVYYEAQIRMNKLTGKGDFGSCQVRGGPLDGIGTFLSVKPAAHPDFKLFFLCRSSSGRGKSLLHWSIGIDEVVEADKTAIED